MAEQNGISGESLAVLSAAVAVALSNGLDADALNLFANFLASVSQVMSLIATQREQTEQGTDTTVTPVPL